MSNWYYVNSMCFANGLSFILTSNGLYYNDSVDILKDCNISSMRLDIMGNYWIATLNNGLYCLARDFAGSANYDRAYTAAIKYAYARKGRVFYTDNLDDLYGLDQGRARRIYSSHLLQQTVNQVSVERAYLIDTAFNYYYLHDRSNVILSHIDGPHPVAVHNNIPRLSAAVKAIFAVGDRVYIKQRSILCSFRKDDFGKTDFSYSLNSDSLSTERILGMAVNADGEVWYSNIGNVFKVVNGQGAVQRQFGDKTFRNFVFAGQCLVGYSLDNQLLVCSNIDGRITIDSLPAQNCIWDKLFVIDSTHVLISTDNLYHLLTIWRNGTRLAARVNAVDNPFIPLNAEAVCPDGDNCYFFKEGAVIRLNKSALLEQPKPPLLRFRGVRDGSTRYTIDSLVSIPYGSRNVVISFSALSFTGKKIVYEYSISGMEGDSWMPLKSEEINLFNPEYGTYIVKVRARSVSGEFCAPITFVLEVRRPFWAAWWFIGLCVAVVAAVVVAVVRRRIARTVREKDAENENKLKFMRSEYKALNALMNPHFIFNTLNNVQGLINSNDRLAANEYLRVFADMVRQNMHNISKELIPLTREIELVENYLRLEKLRFKELLNYRVDIDDEVDASLIMVPPLLIQPLVENSIKHGILPLQSVEGMIIVHVYERSELLYIEVRDNGAGMSGSAHKSDTMHESFGLNNIKERIAQLGILLNKQINFEITEEKDAGSQWTVVTISMEG